MCCHDLAIEKTQYNQIIIFIDQFLIILSEILVVYLGCDPHFLLVSTAFSPSVFPSSEGIIIDEWFAFQIIQLMVWSVTFLLKGLVPSRWRFSMFIFSLLSRCPSFEGRWVLLPKNRFDSNFFHFVTSRFKSGRWYVDWRSFYWEITFILLGRFSWVVSFHKHALLFGGRWFLPMIRSGSFFTSSLRCTLQLLSAFDAISWL